MLNYIYILSQILRSTDSANGAILYIYLKVFEIDKLSHQRL